MALTTFMSNTAYLTLIATALCSAKLTAYCSYLYYSRNTKLLELIYNNLLSIYR